MPDSIKSVGKYFSFKYIRNWLMIIGLLCCFFAAVSFPEKIQDKSVLTYWVMSIIAVVYFSQNEAA